MLRRCSGVVESLDHDPDALYIEDPQVPTHGRGLRVDRVPPDRAVANATADVGWGREHQVLLAIQLDLGAGVGGALASLVLARAGLRVVCLEQGGWTRPEDHPHASPDWEWQRATRWSTAPNVRRLFPDHVSAERRNGRDAGPVVDGTEPGDA